jgi:hypothetical protein
MKARMLMLAIVFLTTGCARQRVSDVGPMRSELLLGHPVRDVWDATMRLIMVLEWDVDIVDEDSWSVSTKLMSMPAYGNSRWWDCGLPARTVADLESSPTRPRPIQIVATHLLRITPITEDSTAVVLTMAPHRLSDVLMRCRSLGGYERQFYEQLLTALEGSAMRFGVGRDLPAGALPDRHQSSGTLSINLAPPTNTAPKRRPSRSTT